MDAIIFYNGEEKEYIIEKNNLTSSIFKEQYEKSIETYPGHCKQSQ